MILKEQCVVEFNKPNKNGRIYSMKDYIFESIDYTSNPA